MSLTNFVRPIFCIGALALTQSAGAALLLIGQDTFLKTTTAQASSLPAASKCLIAKGVALQVSSSALDAADHIRVTLPRAYIGCGLTTGFIFQPHTSNEANALSVVSPTVFKRTTASASTLPAASKCDMPVGAYGLSSGVVAEAGHLKVNLKALLPSCGFSLGYVFDGHATAGIQTLSLAGTTFFKKTTADSSALAAADKCQLAVGNYALTRAATTNGSHYSITLAKAAAGCGFTSGFVFFQPTYLAEPNPAPAPSSYQIPMPSGMAFGGGFAWCVCRNVGTSPHIGQDWNADVAEKSVALANGRIIDKSFSSSCGHTLVMRDTGGADWTYRHLNSNAISVNQTVTRGQFLGNHGDFPTSGCGTGPHLHLERRSAGIFADSARFKSCEAGPEPCFFDPNKPFVAKSLQSAESGELAVSDLASATETLKPAQCRANPAGYPEVDAALFANYPLAGSAVSAVALAQAAGDQRQLTIGAAISGNSPNSCSAGNCLTAMSVIVELNDGTFKRVLHDGSIKNRGAAILAEEANCLPPSATGKVILLLKDQRGAKYRKEVML